MVQKKKSDEQDVLVVRDEKTGEISVVAGLSRDGTPKRAPAKAENTSDFLRFDRNSDLMDSFFRNFFRQCKEPSRFGFYRIAADQVENLLGVMKELLKDPEANKEILSAHKVDTSNYEKEAKQSEGQAKETASSDDASKTQANTEKENVSSEQTNEKENDMEQKPEQTATEQQAQTAPGVKQNLISGNDVNLQELGAKYGIDFNSMNEKDMKALLNYGKTGLVIVKPTFGGEQIEIQARLSFRKDDNDQLQLVPHFVRNEPNSMSLTKAIPSLQRTRRTCCRTVTSERLWISPTRIQVSCVLISSVSTVSPMRLLTSLPTRCAYPIPSARHLLPRTTRECSTQVFRFARRLSLPTGASLHRCCR